MLAFVALSEQEFFDGWASPHLNATIFRPLFQGVCAGTHRLSIIVNRRDGPLVSAGYQFQDVTFQAPLESMSTSCPHLSEPLVKAVNSAWSKSSVAWSSIVASLPAFLIANSESSELPSETCAMMSAIAMERLLSSDGNAYRFSQAFADAWKPAGQIRVQKAKYAKATDEGYPEQQNWFIHRKWAKELYEARSAAAHRVRHDHLSTNWSAWQHVVATAFAYPLVAKRLLEKEAAYELTRRERASCEAFDELLDSQWGMGMQHPPEWREVLSFYRAIRAWGLDSGQGEASAWRQYSSRAIPVGPSEGKNVR